MRLIGEGWKGARPSGFAGPVSANASTGLFLFFDVFLVSRFFLTHYHVGAIIKLVNLDFLGTKAHNIFKRGGIMSKRNQRRWVRNRVLRMEELEPIVVLSWDWINQFCDTYIDPVVNKYVAPIVNTVVDTGKAIVETTVKVVDTFVDEVDEHLVDPVAKTAKSIDKYAEKATDAVFDTGVKVASGVYDGLAITASSIVDLAVDVASVSAFGVAIDPGNAAKTVEKWGNAIATVVADPGVLVDAVVDQYNQEYAKNGAAGLTGMLSADIVPMIVGVGEASSAAKAAKVSKIPSRLAKAVDVADDIAIDVAKTARRSTTVMADTGRAVGSSYSSKSTKVVFENPSSGETLVHLTREDGTRDLFFSEKGSSVHGHAVLNKTGNPKYLRDTDGHVVADDQLPKSSNSEARRSTTVVKGTTSKR